MEVEGGVKGGEELGSGGRREVGRQELGSGGGVKGGEEMGSGGRGNVGRQELGSGGRGRVLGNRNIEVVEEGLRGGRELGRWGGGGKETGS